MEKIKEVPGYGGKYSVTDSGRVLSSGGELSVIDGKYVNLSGRFGVDKVSVAYLVARAFLPNLEARPYVVHVNGDREDNRVENLRWSETREARKKKSASGGGVSVMKRGTLVYVGTFTTLRAACDNLGVDYCSAKRVADGKQQSAGGYVFRWW